MSDQMPMSPQMRMPQGPPAGARPQSSGMPPRPGGQPTNALDANRSMFNPSDAANTAQKFGPTMTIRQLIEDVLRIPGGMNAPATSLVTALKGQRSMSDPMAKMRGMAGQPGQGMPQAPPRQPMGAPPQMPQPGMGGGPMPQGPGGQRGPMTPGPKPGMNELLNRL